MRSVCVRARAHTRLCVVNVITVVIVINWFNLRYEKLMAVGTPKAGPAYLQDLSYQSPAEPTEDPSGGDGGMCCYDWAYIVVENSNFSCSTKASFIVHCLMILLWLMMVKYCPTQREESRCALVTLETQSVTREQGGRNSNYKVGSIIVTHWLLSVQEHVAPTDESEAFCWTSGVGYDFTRIIADAPTICSVCYEYFDQCRYRIS